MARALLALLLTVGVAGSTPAIVAACSCAEASEDEYFAGADVVIEGVVTRSDDPFGWFNMASSADPMAYTIAVDKVLKGDAVEEVEVLTPRSGASCGVSLAVGQRWRLYAYRHGGDLNVSLCSGNELLEQQEPLAESASQDQRGPMGAALSFLPAAVGGLMTLLALIVFRQMARS